MKSPAFLFTAWLALCGFNDSYAQIVTFHLKDSSTVTGKIMAITSKQVQTSVGVLELNQIHKATFQLAERKKAKQFIPTLKKAGITLEDDPEEQERIRYAPRTIATVKPPRPPASTLPAPGGSLGAGYGLSYGGYGARGTYYVLPNLGVFLAAGYAVVGPGFNGGFTVSLAPRSIIHPHMLFMYGYNAAVILEGSTHAIRSSKLTEALYSGPTFGFGVNLRAGDRLWNTWRAEVLFPFRSSDYDAHVKTVTDYAKTFGYVNYKSQPSVVFSIGYSFGFKPRE